MLVLFHSYHEFLNCGRGEVNKSRSKVMNSNQGMRLIKLSQDIQLWQIAGYSITINGKRLNHVEYAWEFSLKPKEED